VKPTSFRECELPCAFCMYIEKAPNVPPYDPPFCSFHEYRLEHGEAYHFRCDNFYEHEPEG
jgi:hypothetical protein